MKKSFMVPNGEFIKAAALGRGWQLKANTRRWSILTRPDNLSAEISIPQDASASDYQRALDLSFEALADAEELTSEQLWDILNHGQPQKSLSLDRFRLRTAIGNPQSESIPLQTAKAFLASTEELVRIAATAIHQPDHRAYLRTDNALSKLLVGATRFEHTRKGSFILSVSSDVFALDKNQQLGGDERLDPTTRRVYTHLYKSLTRLADAVISNRIGELIDETLKATHPLVNANECEALAELTEYLQESDVEINFEWATAVPVTMHEPADRIVNFARSMTGQLEDIAYALRGKSVDETGVFFGTVEQMLGDEVTDVGRAGPVMLLVTTNGRPIKARVELDASQYQIALDAHARGRQYVRVEGLLQFSPRVSHFQGAVDFKLAS
jgi:hypothetical protein